MHDTAAAGICVRELEPAAAPRWDAFVADCPEATFFHKAGWKRVIEEGLGHRTYFLYAERPDGRIDGILPLAFIRSRLFGRSLTSTAFCVYGGPVASTAAAERALTSKAIEIGNRLDVGYIEYRSRKPIQTDGWKQKPPLYATFRKALDPDPERNFLAIPRKQRAMVRKGISAGLVSQVDTEIDRLHAVYAESVRNLGTPVFPRRYFAMLMREFAADAQVLTILHQGRAIGSVMSFFFRDEVLPYYGGGTAAARDAAANDFMYWEVMRRAVERGYRLFDFGRSKIGTGAFRFKTHWGFDPEPLDYQYYLVRSREMPDVNPLNPKYQRLIAAWKRLPLPVANFVGPWIARDLG